MEEDIENNNWEDINNEEDVDKKVITKTGRKVKLPSHLNEYEVYTFYYFLSTTKDPQSYEETIKKQEWHASIQKKINSHEKLGTWVEAESPPQHNAVETKWVFRTKEDANKKAKLVARGFEVEEINIFEQIYAPVARKSTIRILLSQAL